MDGKKQQIDIEHIAKLTRIELTDEERTKFAGQIDQMLTYFEKIQSLDTDGVKAAAHPFDLFNVWQEDVPGECFTPEQALMNAPDQKDNQIRVPQVVE